MKLQKTVLHSMIVAGLSLAAFAAQADNTLIFRSGLKVAAAH